VSEAPNVVPIRPGFQVQEGEDLPHFKLMQEIARVAHEGVCGLRQANGFGDCPPWEETTVEERQHAMQATITVIRHRSFDSEGLHEKYIAEMQDNGWTYGEAMDPQLKTSPMLVPFAALPIEQRQEDMVFRAIVLALYTR